VRGFFASRARCRWTPSDAIGQAPEQLKTIENDCSPSIIGKQATVISAATPQAKLAFVNIVLQK
jgi:hypothetical protein